MLSNNRIYLDANATTPPLPEVVAAAQVWNEQRFGNASAVHSFGRGARAAVDRAREQVGLLLNANPADITFTSGGTESDNLALLGILQAGDHLVTTRIEHDAVLHAAASLEQAGVRVTYVDCDRSGAVRPADVLNAMTSATRLVSVMLANNETGVVQHLEEIAQVAHRAGAWLHTDAVQACGKMPVDVRGLSCDLLSLSAHKLHAAQGVGALWVRPGIPLRAIMHGGSHERRRRAGTENVAGIVSLGAAAAMAQEWLASDGVHELRAMRDRLESALEMLEGTKVHGKDALRLPNTTCISFAGVNAEELVIALDLQGVAISGGSACQSGAIEPSHVLRAMGLRDADAYSSVRISLSRLNSMAEVDRAVKIICYTVTRMRAL